MTNNLAIPQTFTPLNLSRDVQIVFRKYSSQWDTLCSVPLHFLDIQSETERTIGSSRAEGSGIYMKVFILTVILYSLVNYTQNKMFIVYLHLLFIYYFSIQALVSQRGNTNSQMRRDVFITRLK